MKLKLSYLKLLLIGGALFLSSCFALTSSISNPFTSSSASISSSVSSVSSSEVISSSSSSEIISSSSISSSSSSSSSSSQVTSSSSSSSATPVVVGVGLYDYSNQLLSTMTGEQLEEGFVVRLQYSNGALVPTVDYTIAWDGLDIEQPLPGEYEVVISYLTFTHTVLITIEPPEIVDLTIYDAVGIPVTQLTMGSINGPLVVKAMLDNGTEIIINDYTIDDGSFDENNPVPGTYTITFSYMGFDASFELVVPVLTSLGIIVNPTSVPNLKLGESFNPNLLEVYELYADGRTELLNYSLSQFYIENLAQFNPTTPGSYTLTVIRNQFETTFELIVIDPTDVTQVKVNATNWNNTVPLNASVISFDGLIVSALVDGEWITLTASEYNIVGAIRPDYAGVYPLQVLYHDKVSNYFNLYVVDTEDDSVVDFFIDSWGFADIIDYPLYDFTNLMTVINYRALLGNGVIMTVDNGITTRVLKPNRTEFVPLFDEFNQPVRVPAGIYTIEATAVIGGVTFKDTWEVEVLGSSITQTDFEVEYAQGPILVEYGSNFDLSTLIHTYIEGYRIYSNGVRSRFYDFYVNYNPTFDTKVPGAYIFTAVDGTYDMTFEVVVLPPSFDQFGQLLVDAEPLLPDDLTGNYVYFFPDDSSSAVITLELVDESATFVVYEGNTLVFQGTSTTNGFEVLMAHDVYARNLVITLNSQGVFTTLNLHLRRVNDTLGLTINGQDVFFDEYNWGTIIVGRDDPFFTYQVTYEPGYRVDVYYNYEKVVGSPVNFDNGAMHNLEVVLLFEGDRIDSYNVMIRRDPIIEGFLINGVEYTNTLEDGITYEIHLTSYANQLTIQPIFEQGIDPSLYDVTIMNHIDRVEIVGPMDIEITDYFFMADLRRVGESTPLEFYDIWLTYSPDIEPWTSFTVNGDDVGYAPMTYYIDNEDLFVSFEYGYLEGYSLSVVAPDGTTSSPPTTGFFHPIYGGDNKFLFILTNGTHTYRYPVEIARYSSGLEWDIQSITVKGYTVDRSYNYMDYGIARVPEGTVITTSDFVVTLKAGAYIHHMSWMQFAPNQFLMTAYNALDEVMGYYSVDILPTTPDYIVNLEFDYANWFVETTPGTYQVEGLYLDGQAGVTEYALFLEVYDSTALISFGEQEVTNGLPLYVTAVVGWNVYDVTVSIGEVDTVYQIGVQVEGFDMDLFSIEIADTMFTWSLSESDFIRRPDGVYLTLAPVIIPPPMPVTTTIVYWSWDDVTYLDNDMTTTNGLMPTYTEIDLPILYENEHWWVQFYVVIDDVYYLTLIPIDDGSHVGGMK